MVYISEEHREASILGKVGKKSQLLYKLPCNYKEVGLTHLWADSILNIMKVRQVFLVISILTKRQHVEVFMPSTLD